MAYTAPHSLLSDLSIHIIFRCSINQPIDQSVLCQCAALAMLQVQRCTKHQIQERRNWRRRLLRCSRAADCLVPSLAPIPIASILHHRSFSRSSAESDDVSVHPGIAEASKSISGRRCTTRRSPGGSRRQAARSHSDSSQLPPLHAQLQATFTPAANMLKPVAQMLAPCSLVSGGCLRQKLPRPPQ